MANITYANKDKTAPIGTAPRTWRDEDANEVKNVVNNFRASLDSGGKVPIAELPDEALKIGDSTDFDGTGIADGYLVYWDQTAGKFKVKAGPGGIGDVDIDGNTDVFLFDKTNVGGDITLLVGLNDQLAKTVLAAPENANGTPAFRRLKMADIIDGEQETDARYFEVISEVLTLKYILPDIAALQAFVRGPAVLAYVSDPLRGGYFNYVTDAAFSGSADMGVSFPAQDGGYWVRDYSTDYVFPQWWGAKADGVNDDTSAIQTAIDLYRSVMFPPGVYRTTAPIKVWAVGQHLMTNGTPNHNPNAGAGFLRPNQESATIIKYDGVSTDVAVILITSSLVESGELVEACYIDVEEDPYQSVGAGQSLIVPTYITVDPMYIDANNKANYGVYSFASVSKLSFLIERSLKCNFYAGVCFSTVFDIYSRDADDIGIAVGNHPDITSSFSNALKAFFNANKIERFQSLNSGKKYVSSTNEWVFATDKYRGCGIYIAPTNGNSFSNILAEKSRGIGVVINDEEIGFAALDISTLYMERNNLNESETPWADTYTGKPVALLQNIENESYGTIGATHITSGGIAQNQNALFTGTDSTFTLNSGVITYINFQGVTKIFSSCRRFILMNYNHAVRVFDTTALKPRNLGGFDQGLRVSEIEKYANGHFELERDGAVNYTANSLYLLFKVRVKNTTSERFSSVANIRLDMVYANTDSGGAPINNLRSVSYLTKNIQISRPFAFTTGSPSNAIITYENNNETPVIHSTGQVITYTNGDTEIVADDIIEGGTSGATGKVRTVSVDSGSFAGGDAAGKIVLYYSDIDWVPTEDILLSAVKVADATAYTADTGTENNFYDDVWAEITSGSDTDTYQEVSVYFQKTKSGSFDWKAKVTNLKGLANNLSTAYTTIRESSITFVE